MKRYATIIGTILVTGLALAGAGLPQEPVMNSAAADTRSAQAGLSATVKEIAKTQTGPVWIIYEVPSVKANFHRCCYCNDEAQVCALEGDHSQSLFHTDDNDGNGSRTLVVALRVSNGSVGKVNYFSGECELDAGEVTVTNLGSIDPAESVTYLASFVGDGEQSSDTQPKSGRVLSAIAMHDDSSADDALERFVAAGQPRRLRKRAAFWMGEARGARGFRTLQKLVREDDDDRFRKDAVFAIHISDEAESLDELIRLAREDGSTRVRKQALFWLGQRAGKKAVAALTDAVENDPDTKIKKQAVFGLSQLPPEEGLPLLMKIARTHKNPAVRKQAFFWLGQSGEPQALAFFEEVLAQ